MSWDNLDLLRTREAVLANGGRVPLADAVDRLDRLQTAVGTDDQEWDVLYYLRELALDRPVDDTVRRSFARDGLLGPDGGLDANFRDVILSGVRGQDRALYLESPFTDSLDRVLAEYALARRDVVAAANLGQLDTELARSFLAPDRFERAMDVLKDPTDVPPSPPETPDIPPHLEDPKSFAERILKRSNPPSPDSPPPPPK